MVKQALVPVARKLRREMSLPERLLWNRLKTRSPDLPVIRRQYPFGSYVFDFYCAKLKLVIEIDGWGHNMGDTPQKDEVRDAWLRAHGFDIMRIEAGELLKDTDDMADGIVRYIREKLVTTP